MMRNNDEFKAEILRRKETCLKKRRTRITVLSSGAVALGLCLALLFAYPGSRGKNEMLESAPDVMVRITVGDTVYTDSESVGLFMEALAKYVPLPEGDCVVESESSSESSVSTSHDYETAPSVGSSANVSTESTPSDDTALTISGYHITVTVGNNSQTYFLWESGINAGGEFYPLAAEEYAELRALFGTEDSQ